MMASDREINTMVFEPVVDEGDVQLYHGDCIEVMAALEADSVDAIVTDPPYGIDFMGKSWDKPGEMVGTATGISGGFQRFPPGVKRPEYRRSDGELFERWCEAWATQALRVLKPGGHVLAFGGTRMWHRLACGIEDAGFEIRDTLAWLYGQGFPKSVNVSKRIDAKLGATREVIGEQSDGIGAWNDYRHGEGEYPVAATVPVTAAASDEAKEWDGWGTALKPAHEPIVLARKALAGTVEANVLEHGTGAINIDACRIAMDPDEREIVDARSHPNGSIGGNAGGSEFLRYDKAHGFKSHDAGRWPSNVILDKYTAAMLDEQTGTLTSGANPTRRGADGDRTTFGKFDGQAQAQVHRGADSGGASRFFYVAKPTISEKGSENTHPTVKPRTLMELLLRELAAREDAMRDYLVRLITRPGGVVLDPFAGSGTTLIAARREGMRAVGIEQDAEYVPQIQRRLAGEPTTLFGGAS